MYGRPVGFLLYTKWQIRNEPKLWNVPRPLSLGAPVPSAGRKFSYFGYEFDSPWTELMRQRKMESVAILNFSTGGFIEVLAPSKNGNELDAMKHEAEKRGVDIRNVFGDETTHSNYALRSKVLSLTPRDLRLFSSRQEMVANSVLLILKKTEKNHFPRRVVFFPDRMVPRFSRWRPGTRQDGHCGSLRLARPQNRTIYRLRASREK